MKSEAVFILGQLLLYRNISTEDSLFDVLTILINKSEDESDDCRANALEALKFAIKNNLLPSILIESTLYLLLREADDFYADFVQSAALMAIHAMIESKLVRKERVIEVVKVLIEKASETVEEVTSAAVFALVKLLEVYLAHVDHLEDIISILLHHIREPGAVRGLRLLHENNMIPEGLQGDVDSVLAVAKTK